MKEIHAKGGPLQKRPFYERHDVERTCIEELSKAGLLPDEPAPIRIDQFIETRFNIVPEYEELTPGLLGFTRFTALGAQSMVISRSLAEDGSTPARRRLRTTFAHEAGHALLHSHLFMSGRRDMSTLFNPEHKDLSQVLCRDVVGSENTAGGYKKEWWEYQANMAMAALLLPETLFRKAASPFLKVSLLDGGAPEISDENRALLTETLSDIFDVNPRVIQYRLKEVYG